MHHEWVTMERTIRPVPLNPLICYASLLARYVLFVIRTISKHRKLLSRWRWYRYPPGDARKCNDTPPRIHALLRKAFSTRHGPSQRGTLQARRAPRLSEPGSNTSYPRHPQHSWIDLLRRSTLALRAGEPKPESLRIITLLLREAQMPRCRE